MWNISVIKSIVGVEVEYFVRNFSIRIFEYTKKVSQIFCMEHMV